MFYGNTDNKTGNVRIMYYWGALVQPLWRCKNSNITYSECVGRIRYPGCKAHAPYCHCGLPGCTIFFRIISETARFSGKTLLDTKCVFWFSLQLSSETFLILGTGRSGHRILAVAAVKTGPGAHPALCTRDPGLFRGGNAAGVWRWPPTPI
jgi:hypothetical protein